MHSSLIGKIEKARRYAAERDRVKLTEFKADFRGEHDIHEVTFHEGDWHCTCEFFTGWGTCSHTMAMQRILAEFIPEELPSRQPVA